jgi:hypothetical protein
VNQEVLKLDLRSWSYCEEQKHFHVLTSPDVTFTLVVAALERTTATVFIVGAM